MKLSRIGVLLAAALTGCAGGGIDEATLFSDPATYALYDCKQLETMRKSYSMRKDELEGLMRKAETGAGGAVIAEVAYRQDYTVAVAHLKSIDSHWRRNGCDRPASTPADPRPGQVGQRTDPGRGGVY